MKRQAAYVRTYVHTFVDTSTTSAHDSHSCVTIAHCVLLVCAWRRHVANVRMYVTRPFHRVLGAGGEAGLCGGGERGAEQSALLDEGAPCLPPARDKADGTGTRGNQDGAEDQVGVAWGKGVSHRRARSCLAVCVLNTLCTHPSTHTSTSLLHVPLQYTVYEHMCARTYSTFIHTCPPPVHSASLLLPQRSFIASTPTHSSTPLGLAPPTAGLGRHKSIMEEIQDTSVSWEGVSL